MKRTTTFWLIIAALAIGLAVTGTAQQDRYAGVSATRKVGEDTYLATKTIIVTISLDDDTSTDDFQFDDDAVHSDPQSINVGNLVLPYSEILSAHIRCFESIGAGTFDVRLGISPNGQQIFASIDVDGANEIVSTPAGASPEMPATNTGTVIFFTGDPSGNWDAAGSAGRWALMFTYIDYGAVYTADVP